MSATKCNGPEATNDRPAKPHTQHASILGATPAQVNTVDLARQAKDTAALTAKFSLAGHSVHRGDDGDFLVCRYGLSRWCKNFAELQAFAIKLGLKL